MAGDPARAVHPVVHEKWHKDVIEYFDMNRLKRWKLVEVGRDNLSFFLLPESNLSTSTFNRTDEATKKDNIPTEGLQELSKKVDSMEKALRKLLETYGLEYMSSS
ncbi:hypothetical protein C2S52_007347 [Perilla frutescens var. hirtella]|nr:hypothetical protein C2S51_008547 [Perilla frutescens var. frutescens]KAH6787795.1 hypothetical protein C2S52_007347 [Perilla frutescens var. hirtella]